MIATFCITNPQIKKPMKLIQIFVLTIAASAFSLTTMSCKQQKGPTSETGDKIDDTLDQRPAEKVRDEIEKVTE